MSGVVPPGNYGSRVVLIGLGMIGRAVAELLKGLKVDAFEWGGDTHAPAGRLDVAREVARRSVAARLRTPSYGSYFRLTPESLASEFAPVVARPRRRLVRKRSVCGRTGKARAR